MAQAEPGFGIQQSAKANSSISELLQGRGGGCLYIIHLRLT